VHATNNETSRRSAFKTLFATLAAAGAAILGMSHTRHADAGEITRIPDGQQPAATQPPLFSSAVAHNGFVFVAGKGEHGPGDIAVHTKSVLDQLEAELKKAGSSMEKVLKVNVYLHDMRDFEGMNAVYRGRFGAKPPVRTTIAAFGGIPGQSLVEMDCIAAL
jgi:enamine deaminase RidA (YjgF/YER057c/UK114 family)